RERDATDCVQTLAERHYSAGQDQQAECSRPQKHDLVQVRAVLHRLARQQVLFDVTHFRIVGLSADMRKGKISPALLSLRAQGIEGRFESPESVVRALGAMQAQDYYGGLWAIGLRTKAGVQGDVEQALAEGTIVRSWPMRGTLHIVPAEDARWMLELMTPR